MNSKLRQKILKEVVGGDQNVAAIIGGSGHPDDIYQYIKARADSNFISDQEIKNMLGAVRAAYKKCDYKLVIDPATGAPKRQGLEDKDYQYCDRFKSLVPSMISVIQNEWTTLPSSWQDNRKKEFFQTLNAAKYLQLKAADDAAPGTSPAPAPPTDPSSGEVTGTYITCRDTGSVIKFQKWLKATYKQNICADGKFGPKTFNAAKKAGKQFPLFFEDFNFLKKDATARNQICTMMASGNGPWQNQDPTPEKCTARKSTPSPKPPTQPQTQQDVLRTLAASDTGWQQKMNQEQTNKFVSAYNQNQAFRNAVDAAAKKGVLNTDWIFNNYKNYIRQDLAESYNFYDKQKVDGANLLYEKLIKLYTDKEKL